MKFPKLLGPLLAVVLAGGVGSGIWFSNQHLHQEKIAVSAPQETTIRGLIGSEKQSFFLDERVVQTFRKHGITVIAEKDGSRSIANRNDYGSYDFGFPSGANTGEQLKKIVGAKETYVPFYTPVVVASWRPIAEILQNNAMVEEKNGIFYLKDFSRLLVLIEANTRWKDLPGSEAFPTSKAVLVASTDVRTSNSAMMYLALASYILNGESVVQNAADVQKVGDAVAKLFLRQGFQESSSAGPFEDYLALGMGKTPMLMAYESQLIEYWHRRPEHLKGDMVLIYPKPTVFSKHVFVPFNDRGARLGELLANDAELQSIAHEYGFRTGGETKGPEIWAARSIHVPEILVDVIDPPSYEWMESLIKAVEVKFK